MIEKRGSRLSKERIQESTGALVVLTGFTGAGKTEIRNHLIERNPHLNSLVTTTSRLASKRSDGTMEEDGIDYHFISRPLFLAGIAASEFVEYVNYPAREGREEAYYGTTKRELERILNGENLVSTMEMNGAGNLSDNIISAYGEEKGNIILAKTQIIFVDGGSELELLRRYIQRGGIREKFEERIIQDRALFNEHGHKFVNKVFNYFGMLQNAVEEAEELIELSLRK